MNEKETISRALQTEQRMMQRQQLLKQLWWLKRSEKSSQSLPGGDTLRTKRGLVQSFGLDSKDGKGVDNVVSDITGIE